MADVSSTPVLYSKDEGHHTLLQTSTGIDGDTDVTVTIDCFDSPGWLPKAVTFMFQRTAGSTDTISVQLEGSFDGTNFKIIGSAVTDITGGFTAITVNADKPAPYYRLYVTTVGAGNTLKSYLLLHKSY
jgi:hypothetical protein